MAVTREQIIAAAEQIAAEGKNPTLAAVREVTGGSYTTISPVLNEWKEKQKKAASPIRDPAPQEISARLTELGTDIWAIALNTANNRLAIERESLEKARAEMEATQTEAIQLADSLTSELDEEKGKTETLEKMAITAREEIAQLASKLATVSERAATAEARAAELRKELDHAHQEVRNIRIDRDVARQSAERSDADLAEQREVNQDLATQLKNTHEELSVIRAKAQADHDSFQEQRKIAAAEAHRAAENLTHAKLERDEARKESRQAREEAAKLTGQLDILQQQNAALLARIIMDGKNIKKEEI